MNKQHEESNHSIRKIKLPGESSHLDKGTLACDLIMLGIFLWNQICYGMDMMFLIIPLALLGTYLLLFCVYPEEYCFADTGLEVHHKFRKTVVIPYDAVFNYEASSHDSFINILQSNKVKVYYAQARQKRMIQCLPRDVESFVEALKWNCAEFHEDKQEKSKLEVFFNNTTK